MTGDPADEVERHVSEEGIARFAATWSRAIADTSYVTLSAAEVNEHLRQLTWRLCEVLCADPFDGEQAAEQATAVGASLVQQHFTGVG
ncbi:MAG: hypothetical protein ACRDQ5_22970, partial [Sciscionella sp.]